MKTPLFFLCLALIMWGKLHSYADCYYDEDLYYKDYPSCYEECFEEGFKIRPHEISVEAIFARSTVKDFRYNQKGWALGGKIGYDFIRAGKIYVGAELGSISSCVRRPYSGYHAAKEPRYDLYAEDMASKESFLQEEGQEKLSLDDRKPSNYPYFSKGKSRADYDYTWLEGRVGFTLGEERDLLISPFFLIGTENISTHYKSPWHIKHSRDHSYGGVGLLSRFYVSEKLFVGINLKLKCLFGGKRKVKSDWVSDHSSSAGFFHYSFDVPIMYQLTHCIALGVVPFYHYKKFDRHLFDLSRSCKDSSHLFGANLKLQYNF